jgi:hypothetical protein
MLPVLAKNEYFSYWYHGFTPNSLFRAEQGITGNFGRRSGLQKASLAFAWSHDASQKGRENEFERVQKSAMP